MMTRILPCSTSKSWSLCLNRQLDNHTPLLEYRGSGKILSGRNQNFISNLASQTHKEYRSCKKVQRVITAGLAIFPYLWGNRIHLKDRT